MVGEVSGLNPDGVTKVSTANLFYCSMVYTVYILYSAYLDRYYVGYTGEALDSRRRKHNSSHKGFTGKKPDWVVKYTEIFASKKEAMDRETEIKNWKSRKMIEKLISTE
jgi:putative endonuclease